MLVGYVLLAVYVVLWKMWYLLGGGTMELKAYERPAMRFLGFKVDDET